jgi:hypothetical protein
MRKELGERASEHGVREKRKGKGNHGGWFRVGSSEVLGMRTLFADLQYAMRQLRRSPCLRDYGRSDAHDGNRRECGRVRSELP